MSAPAVILAAPATGAGKTILTMGLIAALVRRGHRVGAFKVGPDYIDPGFLATASGRPCLNLDSWAMCFETLVGLLEAAGREADLVVGEGVMGLFDGAPDGTGSTGDLAALFNLPVILVVDAARMGASAAALIEGFVRFREDVEIAGIILNRVAGPDHARLLVDACDARFSAPVLGWLPRDDALALPSRHLGLIQAAEHGTLDGLIDDAAERVAASLDIERIVRLTRCPSISALGPKPRLLPPLGQRIAIARDAAFGFIYPAVLEGWRRAGAELSFFSPLANEAPARNADAVYLPGGYPELHAGRLAAAQRFLAGLRTNAMRGAFIYGECGGYMVLGRRLTDAAGCPHVMADLLPVETSFAERKLHLGYRDLALTSATPLGLAGTRYRGHEFHYATETARSGAPFARAHDARGRDLGEQGCRVGNVAGSFLHLIDRRPQSSMPR